MRCTLATAVAGAAVLLMLNAFTPQPQGTPLISQLSADDGPTQTRFATDPVSKSSTSILRPTFRNRLRRRPNLNVSRNRSGTYSV